MTGHYSSAGYSSGTSLTYIDGMTFTRDISGDGAIDLSRENMVAVSRRLMRDNPIYKGIIGRCVSYVIGEGFGLQALSDSAEWNDAAEKLWREFWNAPTVDGTLSGKRYEALTFQELIVAGDIFTMLVDAGGGQGLRLQVFEAEQCIPRTAAGTDNGILKDDYGRPLQYVFAPYGKGGYVNRGKVKKYEAANVIHLFDHERPSASRGVPALQSSFAMLHRINDICDAEAIARQMLSHLCLSVTRQDAPVSAYNESTVDTINSKFRIQ